MIATLGPLLQFGKIPGSQAQVMRGFKPCPLGGLRSFDLASGAIDEQLDLELEYLLPEKTGQLLDDFETGKNTIIASPLEASFRSPLEAPLRSPAS